MVDEKTTVEVPLKQTPSLMELSTALSPWTHIRQIRLAESAIKSQFSALPISAAIKQTFDATTVIDRENKTLVVTTHLTVSAGELLQIQANFVLDYSIDQSALDIAASDQYAEAFGKINGIFNVWPYWREYVQSVSTRAGLPPPTMPLMTGRSLVAYYAAKEKPLSDQAAQKHEESGPRPGGAAGL